MRANSNITLPKPDLTGLTLGDIIALPYYVQHDLYTLQRDIEEQGFYVMTSQEFTSSFANKDDKKMDEFREAANELGYDYVICCSDTNLQIFGQSQEEVMAMFLIASSMN